MRPAGGKRTHELLDELDAIRVRLASLRSGEDDSRENTRMDREIRSLLDDLRRRRTGSDGKG